jgi:hypothetical protein
MQANCPAQSQPKELTVAGQFGYDMRALRRERIAKQAAVLHGPIVQRLGQPPFTWQTRVRFPLGLSLKQQNRTRVSVSCFAVSPA